MRRRQFLALSGGAVLYQALAPGLALAKRAAALESSLQPWSLPAEPPANSLDRARALIGAAVLAPSHWNAQPWRFEAEGDEIRLTADPARALPATDPDRRSMMIGLGAALENLLIAARGWGLQPTVEYFPDPLAYDLAARVTIAAGGPRRDRALFEMIPERRTNRRSYDGRGIYPQNRAQLLAQFSGDARLHWLDDRGSLRALADLAHDATRSQGGNRRAATEQAAWMREDMNDARRRGDGLTVDALEYPGLAHWMPGRAFDPDSWFHRFGLESAARNARDGLRSAGAAALITSPKGGESAWVAVGQAYQRLALKATQLGIAHQPISAPIEWELSRPELLRTFDAGGEAPALLVRLGHASAPNPTVRRSVSLVATFRTT
ncbi:MAG: Acg family FMN-binding oxidoreductase [Candidatus Eiseniibacteriota bacterium]